jgi:hypothetical protein
VEVSFGLQGFHVSDQNRTGVVCRLSGSGDTYKQAHLQRLDLCYTSKRQQAPDPIVLQNPSMSAFGVPGLW